MSLSGCSKLLFSLHFFFQVVWFCLICNEQRNKESHSWSNSSRWDKFHPLYEVIGGGVKIFSSLKHNLLQQFPYFTSQLAGPTMPHHLLLPSPNLASVTVWRQEGESSGSH
jgi:hypothetical protein